MDLTEELMGALAEYLAETEDREALLRAVLAGDQT